jgi:lipid A 3-O-deacylase
MFTPTWTWTRSKWSTLRGELSQSKGKETAAQLWRSFFVRDREKGNGKTGNKGTREKEDRTRDAEANGLKIGDWRVAKTLTRVRWFVVFYLFAAALVAAAQPSNGFAADGDDVSNPVARVRDHRSWEYGPFLGWGTGVGERSDFKFFWGGFELSKILSPVVHAGILSGQFQYGGNIMPLWQAYTPPPHNVEIPCLTPSEQLTTCPYPYGGGTFHGVSLTPVIFRWNFLTRSRRWQPWFQAAGGLIYTTHKYPPDYLSNNNPARGPIVDGGTSVWNFSPQGGGGIHYFFRDRRSIDLGVNGVHISSASLGDRNPGVNASVQIQVGYTFWR